MVTTIKIAFSIKYKGVVQCPTGSICHLLYRGTGPMVLDVERIRTERLPFVSEDIKQQTTLIYFVTIRPCGAGRRHQVFSSQSRANHRVKDTQLSRRRRPVSDAVVLPRRRVGNMSLPSPAEPSREIPTVVPELAK